MIIGKPYSNLILPRPLVQPSRRRVFRTPVVADGGLLNYNLGLGIPSGLTFSRDSAATYVDRLGVIRLESSDAPRFETDGLLMEGGATNYVSAYAYWADEGEYYGDEINCTTAESSLTAAYPYYKAVEVVSTTANGTRLQNTLYGLNTAKKFLSAYVSAGTSNYVGLVMANDYEGGVTYDLSDPDAPVVHAYSTSYAPSGYGIDKLRSGIHRAWMSQTTDAETTADPYCGVGPSSGSGFAYSYYPNGAAGTTISTSYRQVENYRLTSLIPSDGAAGTPVTRAADYLRQTNPPWYSRESGSLLVACRPSSAADADQRIALSLDDGGTERLSIFLETNGTPKLALRSDGYEPEIYTVGSVIASGEKFVFGVSWKSGVVTAIACNLGGTTDTLPSTTPMPIDPTLYVGGVSSGLHPFFGHISHLAVSTGGAAWSQERLQNWVDAHA